MKCVKIIADKHFLKYSNQPSGTNNQTMVKVPEITETVLLSHYEHNLTLLSSICMIFHVVLLTPDSLIG